MRQYILESSGIGLPPQNIFVSIELSFFLMYVYKPYVSLNPQSQGHVGFEKLFGLTMALLYAREENYN